MTSSEAISTLNSLLTLTRDGEADFAEASELVVNLKIKELLKKAADRCRLSAKEIASKVAELGGDPEQGRSLAGAARVAWTDLKSKIAGMSDEEVLDECLRSEDSAQAAFEKALTEQLPSDAKALLEKQYAGVKEHYELVRRLRSSFVYGHSKS